MGNPENIGGFRIFHFITTYFSKYLQALVIKPKPTNIQ